MELSNLTAKLSPRKPSLMKRAIRFIREFSPEHKAVIAELMSPRCRECWMFWQAALWFGMACRFLPRVELVDSAKYKGNRSGVSIVEYHKSVYHRKLRKNLEPEHICFGDTLCINDLPRVVPSRVHGWFHANPTAERLIVVPTPNNEIGVQAYYEDLTI